MRKGSEGKNSWPFKKRLPLSVTAAGMSEERVKSFRKDRWGPDFEAICHVDREVRLDIEDNWVLLVLASNKVA